MEEFSYMQIDVTEGERGPPVSFIDFFARDNEDSMVTDVPDQSEIKYTDFFARENQLNAGTDHMVDQREEQSLDFVPLDNQTTYVADQHAEQSQGSFIDFVPLEHAEQSNFLYYDFFNGGNVLNAATNVVEQSVWNTDYYAQENQPSDGADMVEQSVQDTDDYAPENQLSDNNAPENQLSASANVGEQSALNLDYIAIVNRLNDAANALEQVLENIDYYALEYEPRAETDVDERSVREVEYIVLELPSAADNEVEQSPPEIGYIVLENQQIAADNVTDLSVQNIDAMQESFQDIDYIAMLNQLRTAAYLYEQAVLDNEYTVLENHPIVEHQDFNTRVRGENGEMGSDRFMRGLVVWLRYIPELVEDAMSDFESIDEQPFVVRPASRSVVRNLASVTFTQESVERDTVACAICKDDFNAGETAKKLTCSHHFHEDCILPWLDLRNTCPACRYELPTDNDSDDDREENERASPEQGQT